MNYLNKIVRVFVVRYLVIYLQRFSIGELYLDISVVDISWNCGDLVGDGELTQGLLPLPLLGKGSGRKGKGGHHFISFLFKKSKTQKIYVECYLMKIRNIRLYISHYSLCAPEEVGLRHSFIKLL